MVAAPEADNPVRLPRDTDTLPPALAARMLSEATADQVSALPRRQGRRPAAEGLRLQPSDPLSSVGRVDVWADSASGIPVLVEVFGRSDDVAAMSSTFLDFSAVAPARAELAFTVPPGARVRSVPRDDLIRDIARSGGPRPPDTLLGFARSRPGAAVATIGEYGRGVTQLAVGTLPERLGGLVARPAAAGVRSARAARGPHRRGRTRRAAADDARGRRRVAGRGHGDPGGAGPRGRRARCGRLVIRTEGLTKRFGSVTAVDDVGLDVSAGDIYGFLGRERVGQDDDRPVPARAGPADRGPHRAARPKDAAGRR